MPVDATYLPILISVLMGAVIIVLIAPNIVFLITRTPYYEIRVHKDRVFIKRIFKSQRTSKKTFTLRKFGEFLFPKDSMEYFQKGISKIVHYDVNNSAPFTTEEPSKDAITKKVKKVIKKDGEIREVYVPVKMFPNVVHPDVLKELLKDESVQKVMKQPRSSLDAWIPIFIICAILGCAIIGAVLLSQ